jgi:hypothetical protein
LFRLHTEHTTMKINMANWDRVLRMSLAVVIAALYFTGTISGILGIALLALAAIFAGSSAIGVCPMYSLLGIGTRRRKDVAPR